MKSMRIDRLYILSFLASALCVCAGLVLLVAFVYSTGFFGFGVICAAVLVLFACLYGWFRLFNLAGRKGAGEAGSRLTGEQSAARQKV